MYNKEKRGREIKRKSKEKVIESDMKRADVNKKNARLGWLNPNNLERRRINIIKYIQIRIIIVI